MNKGSREGEGGGRKPVKKNGRVGQEGVTNTDRKRQGNRGSRTGRK